MQQVTFSLLVFFQGTTQVPLPYPYIIISIIIEHIAQCEATSRTHIVYSTFCGQNVLI